jgi:hypothetical protein
VSEINPTPKKRRPAGEWRPVFLAALRNSGNVRAACQAAEIDRSTAYDSRDSSKEFAAQWDEALEDAIDVLEAVAQKRARASSDTLLIFLLKAHRPQKFRDPVQRVAYTDPTGEHERTVRLTDSELISGIISLVDSARARAARSLPDRSEVSVDVKSET